MHKGKAQAGMEYVVTYGWLLIFIITVASIFFFIMTPKSTEFRCVTDQPEKFLLKGYNVPEKYYASTPMETWNDNGSETEPIEISLQNSGGEKIIITKIECFAKGKFEDCSNNPQERGFFSNSSGNAKINSTKFTALATTPLQVENNEKILIKNFLIVLSPKDGFLPPGKFRISYTSGNGEQKKVTISCEGYPAPAAMKK